MNYRSIADQEVNEVCAEMQGVHVIDDLGVSLPPDASPSLK